MARLPISTTPAPIISNLNGAIPTAYDPNWQTYTDLTREQILAFQSMPEWQNFLSFVAMSPSTATTGVSTTVVDAALTSNILK